MTTKFKLKRNVDGGTYMEKVEQLDPDFDIFDFNHREHDLWAAINALREIVREGYISEYDWRLNEMANYLEKQLEQ